MRLFGKVFGQQKPVGQRPNAANLHEVISSAARASCHPDNAGAVIVVVELGGLLDATTGEFVARRYNYWTHRPSSNYGPAAADFNNIPRLSAAFLRGRRIDTNASSFLQGGIGKESSFAPQENKKGPKKKP